MCVGDSKELGPGQTDKEENTCPCAVIQFQSQTKFTRCFYYFHWKDTEKKKRTVPLADRVELAALMHILFQGQPDLEV